jgi:hypothetical protein
MKKIYFFMLLVTAFVFNSCNKKTTTAAVNNTDEPVVTAAVAQTTSVVSCGRICAKTVSASCYVSIAACLEAPNQNCTTCAGENTCAVTDNFLLSCSAGDPFILVVGPDLSKPKTASGGQVSDELLAAVMSNFVVKHTIRTGDVAITIARKSDPSKALYARSLKRIGNTNLYKSENITTKCTLTDADAKLVLSNLSNNTICTVFITNLYDSFVLLDKKIN